MNIDRRTLFSAGLGAGATLVATSAASAGPRRFGSSADWGLEPDSGTDQTAALQAAIDESSARKTPLALSAGTYRAGEIVLRPGTRIVGAAGLTILEFAGGPIFIRGENAPGAGLEDLAIDGAMLALDPDRTGGLLSLVACEALTLRNIDVRRSLLDGLSLERCSGRVAECSISAVSQTGVRSLDARGLEIFNNKITDCANNGIQVWRSEPGEDATIVSGNRIERIAARAGGSGENGNGISVFRAGGVLVTGNRIADCAYSAIRANAASDVQMVANSCARLGEVALYAEFGFEGALIASNLVDTAASGIAVTNFNEGGRLAVVQGNLVRNLFMREEEPEDKRGVGISIEADSLVTGNTIEGAPAAGIVIGWGKYMRDCAVTQNLIRNSRTGILVTSDPDSGACLIANNMISGARDGAIRAMRLGQLIGPELAGQDASGARIRLFGNFSA